MKIKKWILLGIYLFVFFVPILPQDKYRIEYKNLPISADTLIIMYIVLLLAIMLLKKENRKEIKKSLNKFIKSYFFMAVIAYTVVCIASLFVAINKKAAVMELGRFWTYIILFFVILVFVDNEEDIKRIVKLFIVSILLTCIYGLSQYFMKSTKFLDATIGMGTGRVFSSFVNPNYWGAFINLVFFPILMLAKNKVKNYRFLYVLLILLFTNSVLSYTRGSWVGMVIGFVLLSILYNIKLLIPVAAIVPLSFFVPKLWQRIMSIFDLKSLTIGERFILWKTGYMMFKEHPILGVGNGNYNFRYRDYVVKYPELYLDRPLYSVHNSYLKVLAETGILGIISFIGVIAFYINEIINVYKNSSNKLAKDMSIAFLCSMASYLFQNISNNLFFIPQLNAFYWIIGALLISYNNIKAVSTN